MANYKKINNLDKLRSGDHTVLLYNEISEILPASISFIKASLQRNEKCLYIKGDLNIEVLLTELRKEISDLDLYIQKGQLQFLSKEETYALSKQFKAEKMIETLKKESTKAIEEGYQGLSITGELSWVLNFEDGKKEIINYEWMLNEFIFDYYPVVAMCRYSLNKFDKNIIKAIIELHHFIIWQNKVHENPYYISPAGYRDNKVVEYEIESWLKNIQEYEKRESIFKEKIREKERIIESLHGVALSFEKLTDEKEVCEKTVEAAEKLLQFELCNIDLIEDGMLIPQAKTTDSKLKKMPITEGVAGQAYRESKSFLIDNMKTSPEAKPVKSTYKSGITIPMGEHGVFQAVAEEEAAFTEEDLEVAEILISHTTAALGRIYSQEELKYKTFHDELTGLYNRRFIEEEMERLDVERQLPISILMVDINGLKLINDSLGHRKGDELLVKTADILKEVFRDEDIIARYGGDEFVILLPQTEKEVAQKIVNRIKRKCQITKDDNLVVSLGAGLATKASVKEDIFDVLQEADDKMYQNKLITSESKKNEIVSSLINALGAKSDETKEHTMRMTALANRLGDSIGVSEEQKNQLSLLATLHDIGKISISEEILTKPGKPTEKEWQILKKHPENGYKIASSSSEFAVVAKDILCHHERWDGGGYPRGLEGEKIPFLARIISIIDAYDVMTNERPYSPAISKEEALQEIKDCAGSQFDPELAKRFVEIMR